VADVVEELVQLERGAALLIGRVGRPFVVVGLEQFWWEAAGQLGAVASDQFAAW
jgi:hypothetical protein